VRLSQHLFWAFFIAAFYVFVIAATYGLNQKNCEGLKTGRAFTEQEKKDSWESLERCRGFLTKGK
jgi:hypothetical protein